MKIYAAEKQIIGIIIELVMVTLAVLISVAVQDLIGEIITLCRYIIPGLMVRYRHVFHLFLSADPLNYCVMTAMMMVINGDERAVWVVLGATTLNFHITSNLHVTHGLGASYGLLNCLVCVAPQHDIL